MKALSKREKVLQNIREARSKFPAPIKIEEPASSDPLFERGEESLPETFAKEFNKISGKFIFCPNQKNFVQQFTQFIMANNWKNIYCLENNIQKLLDSTSVKYKKSLAAQTDAQVGVTSCEALIARTGSILVASGKEQSRVLSVYPPVHVVVATPENLFFDLKDVLNYYTELYGEDYPSMLSIVSGPSRTADIEKTLVLGAHGPRELYCFYINEKSAR